MNIIIDSNIIIADRQLVSTGFRVLFDGLKKGPHHLIVPEIALHEAVNNHQEEMRDELGKVANALERLSKLTPTVYAPPLTETDIKEISGEYESQLKSRFNAAGATWLKYPEADHVKVTRRALDRRKPFDSHGHKGYRDALLWESVLDFASANPTEKIAFVSKNTRDFADKDETSLHPHLVEDVIGRGIPPGNIKFFVGLDAFVDAHITPTLKKLDDVAGKLSEGKFLPFNIKTWAEANLFAILTTEFDFEEFGVPRGLESPHIDDIHDIRLFGEPAVRLLSETEYLIEFTLYCFLELAGTIHKSDHFLMGRPITVTEYNQNDHYMGVSLTTPTGIKMRLTFDEKENSVTSTEVQEVWRDDEYDDGEGDFDGGDDDGGDSDGDDDSRGSADY